MRRQNKSLIAFFLFCNSLLITTGMGQIVPDSLPEKLSSLPYSEESVLYLNRLSDSLGRNHPQAALSAAVFAQTMADSVGSVSGEAHAYSRMGTCSWYLGNYQDALSWHLEARNRYLSLGDSLGFAQSSYDIANVHWRYANYPEAMDNMVVALRIRERLKDSVAIAESYYGMGILQADLLDFSNALINYQKALAIAQALKDKQREADIYNVIGRAWRKQEIYDKAMEAHVRSLALYQELGDEAGISDYYNNVGSIYRRQGNYNEALDYFFEAINIQKKLNDQEGLADGYNDIGTTLMQKGSYLRAIEYLEKGLEISRKTGLKDDVRYALTSLAAVYDSLGDFRRAYFYLREATAVRDSVTNAQVSEQVAQLHIQYQSEKKQQQIDLLKKESELQNEKFRRNSVIIIGVLLILAIFGGSMVYRSRLQTLLNRKLSYKNRVIAKEKERSEELLLNILPRETAEELKLHGKAKARSYEEVTVMFVDFQGFTKLSVQMTPRELVRELHTCFEAFDHIIDKYGLEKIKTIGDAYMCAGGIPVPEPDHAANTIRAGLEIQQFMKVENARKQAVGEPFFQARLGIHTGPVIAGVVGIRKFSYDIWGDTVNTASRMETAGEVGRVNISQDTYERVQTQFICHYRGKVEAKHKGMIDMYFVEWEI
ncbi:MAG: adenylate/guanylate cyclase domain-containing protein [Bacteroidia bacterium]